MNFEAIIPYEKVTFCTNLSKNETRGRLNSQITADLNMGLLSGSPISKTYFIGKFTDYQFEIRRAINYQNSFLPMIQGEILSEFDGCSVSLTLRLHKFVRIFLLLFGTLGLLFGTLYGFSSQDDFIKGLCLPIGMVLFTYILALVGFKAESQPALKYIQKLIEGTRVQAL